MNFLWQKYRKCTGLLLVLVTLNINFHHSWYCYYLASDFPVVILNSCISGRYCKSFSIAKAILYLVFTLHHFISHCSPFLTVCSFSHTSQCLTSLLTLPNLILPYFTSHQTFYCSLAFRHTQLYLTPHSSLHHPFCVPGR